jgi:peptidoglycan hydrolase FlgJ
MPALDFAYFRETRALAITPASDIVLDVARAADPSKYQAAAARLARMGGNAAETRAANAPDWSANLEAAESKAATGSPGFTLPAQTPSRPVSTTAAPAKHLKADPFKQFEAFVLQNFIQLMLPKQAENVFGSGTSGEIWKSMLADKLGSQVAAKGGIGIAARLAKDAEARKAHTLQPADQPAASQIPTGSTLAGTLPYIQDTLRVRANPAPLQPATPNRG